MDPRKPREVTDRELADALRAWVDAGWTPDLPGPVVASLRGLERRPPAARPRVWTWLLAPGALAVAAIALLAWTLGSREALRLPDVTARAPVVAEALRPPPTVPAEVDQLWCERPGRPARGTRRAAGATGNGGEGTLPPLEPPELIRIDRLSDAPIPEDILAIEPLRLDPLVMESLDD